MIAMDEERVHDLENRLEIITSYGIPEAREAGFVDEIQHALKGKIALLKEAREKSRKLVIT
jgi:hypothetical protein